MLTTSRVAMDELLDKLYDQCSEIEIEPFFNYSGRGMYGATCIGFTTNSPLRLVMALGAILQTQEESCTYNGDDNPFPEWFDLSPLSDGMGYNSSIVYFPGWQVEN